MNLKFGKDYQQNSAGLSSKIKRRSLRSKLESRSSPMGQRNAGIARRSKAAKARRAIAAREAQVTNDV